MDAWHDGAEKDGIDGGFLWLSLGRRFGLAVSTVV